jgi:cation transport ATPase
MTQTEPPVQREPLAFHLFQLAVTLMPALPLLADWVGAALGWHIFFLADGRIQSVFATVVLAAGGWPFAAGLLRQGAPPAKRGAHGLTLVAALGLYGWGLYLTYGRPLGGTHDVFQVQAAWLLAATAWRLSLAVAGATGSAAPADRVDSDAH